MAQSADQAAVSGVITAKQLELLVDKVEKKDRGIELFNLMIAAPNWAEVRYIVERKVGLSEWLRVRARLLDLPLNTVPAEQELSEVAGELKR